MALSREQIEHLEWKLRNLYSFNAKPWKKYSHSRKWLKRQMNRFVRRNNKNINQDDIGYKTNRKPMRGYEY